MDKNTIIAIVLSTLVIIGFSMYQMNRMQAAYVEPAADGTVAETAVSSEPAVASQSVLAAATSDFDALSLVEEQYTMETETATVRFTNKGGDIIGYELKEHRDGDHGVYMADSIEDNNRAFALSFGGQSGEIVNDLFETKIIDNYTILFSRPFTFTENGTAKTYTLQKKYTFLPDEYVFRLEISFLGENGATGLNVNNAAYTLRTSPQIGPYWNKANDRYENRTFMAFANDKVKKQTVADGATKTYDNDFTWVGVTGKYFSLLVAPMQTNIVDKAVYSCVRDSNDYANAQVFITRTPILQQSVTDTYYVYMGPRTDSTLKSYSKAENNGWHLANLKFDYCMQSSGILSWLEVALKWIMDLIYKLIPNWGLSIIVMTILLKLALYPLTKKSSMSSLKMQELQPKIQELQEKYKATPEKLNAEMAKVYQEAHYNPMSGCLPILIQFPLLISVFNLFNNYFEFRGAMFIPGWIPDLSVGDSLYTLGFSLPFLGNQIRILPVIYLVSQLIYGKITQVGAPSGQSAGAMKLMTYGMPIFFFFIFYNAPAGLILYWTISNMLQLVQQKIINKQMKIKKAEMEAARANEREKYVTKKRKK